MPCNELQGYVSKGDQYLNKRGISTGIRKMNKKDHESVVTGVLTAILAEFFRSEDGYLIRAEHVANKGFTDLLVLHYDKNDKESQFLVVQCKRLSKEASNATWNEAKNQLKRYLPGLKQQDKQCPVFGVIAIGRYIQFVEYDHKLAEGSMAL